MRVRCDNSSCIVKRIAVTMALVGPVCLGVAASVLVMKVVIAMCTLINSIRRVCVDLGNALAWGLGGRSEAD
jgi:hypothetical protein